MSIYIHICFKLSPTEHYYYFYIVITERPKSYLSFVYLFSYCEFLYVTFQTKLHDTVCNKRQAATIATHDLQLIKSPLIYTALPPKDIKVKRILYPSTIFS